MVCPEINEFRGGAAPCTGVDDRAPPSQLRARVCTLIHARMHATTRVPLEIVHPVALSTTRSREAQALGGVNVKLIFTIMSRERITALFVVAISVRWLAHA